MFVVWVRYFLHVITSIPGSIHLHVGPLDVLLWYIVSISSLSNVSYLVKNNGGKQESNPSHISDLRETNLSLTPT